MTKEAKKVWNHNFNYDPCITLSVHTHSSFLIETFVETFERFVLIMLYVVLHKVISFCFVLSQVFVIFYIWFHWLFFWLIFIFFLLSLMHHMQKLDFSLTTLRVCNQICDGGPSAKYMWRTSWVCFHYCLLWYY